MIYLDCTHIFTYPAPHTGVQRVTRSIAREALILRKDVCLAALYTDNIFYKLTSIPQKDEASFSHKGELVSFCAGDIYFVLDGSWSYQIFEKLLPFKGKYNLVTGVMYHDLIPVLHTNSGVSPDIFTSWLTETARYADFFACNSNNTKSDLGKWLKEYHPNRRLCDEILFSYKLGADIVNNNKTETSLSGELQSIFNKDETYFYVSTLGPTKNHIFLLDVFDSLWRRFPYLKLCFIGREGWTREEKLHRRMEEHPLYSRNLFWFPSLNDEEVYQVYKNSKCLLFPSFIEGFGLPIIEALHSGTPVLASDLPVFHEIAGEAIGYFDPHTPDTLISWIEKIEEKGFPQHLIPADFTWPTWRESAVELLRKIDTAYEYIKINGSSAESFLQIKKEADKMNIEDSKPLSLKGLLRLNGRELIKQAYIRMLHRFPDPPGESIYMEKLLQGLPAISLLSALRFSAEGKSVNEPVKHSFYLRIYGRLLGASGIPGKIARYIYALRSLSGILGKSSAAIIGLQELEKCEAHELNVVKSELLALQQSMNQKFDTYNNFVQSVPVTLRHLQRTEDELGVKLDNLIKNTESSFLDSRTHIGNIWQTNSRLWERLEFIRRELMYEMRYSKQEKNESTKAEAKIVSKDKIEKARQTGIRLNLGCGHIPLEGYINVDMRELPGVDVVADVKDLPFFKGEVDEILLAHCLEHFPQEQLRRELLPYWSDLLRKNGIFRVVVPDAESMMRKYIQEDYPYKNLREVFFGGQDYEGDFHYNMFIPEQLKELFQEVKLFDFKILEQGRPNGQCLEMDIQARKE